MKRRKNIRKSIKGALSVFLVILIMAGAVMVANAANSVLFTKRPVDSNSYSYIESATKTTNANPVVVHITNIYKADGSNSAYSCVWTKATSSGVAQQAVRGDYQELGIPEAYRHAGANIALYAKGNNPLLDCQISGSWMVY